MLVFTDMLLDKTQTKNEHRVYTTVPVGWSQL